MPTTPIDDPVDTKRPRVRIALRMFPLALRRRFPLELRQDKRKVIDYVPDTDSDDDEAEPKAGGKPPIKLVSFLLIVLIPFLSSVVYYAFIATDQYTAEARFAVRSLVDDGTPENVDSGILSMRSATQDAYVVTSFIHSTEILRRIAPKVDYLSMFARSDADFLSRFDISKSTEAFQSYWKKQVSAYIDGPSGIITLKVRSFRPEDSVKLADAIVEQSEILINELSQRARQDVLTSVRGEVERTGTGYGNALAALNKFQHESGLLSPEVQALETGKLLTGLLAKKLEIETRLFVIKQSSAEGSPAYDQLSRTQTSLDSQIAKMQSELTGPENASISKAILEFSKFETDRLVAEKLYEAARNNYDSALADSLRKALYLVVFVHPSLPQDALYPTRIASPFMILLGLIVFWATLMLAWASIEDHRL